MRIKSEYKGTGNAETDKKKDILLIIRQLLYLTLMTLKLAIAFKISDRFKNLVLMKLKFITGFYLLLSLCLSFSYNSLHTIKIASICFVEI